MKKLKDMNVKQRLFTSFLGVVGLASLAGIISVFLLLILDHQYSTALVQNGFIQGDIGEYNVYLNKSAAFVRDIIMLDDESEIASAKSSLEASDEKIDYYLAAFEKQLENEEEQALMNIIYTKYPEYVAIRDEAIELGMANKNDEALAMFREEAIPILMEVMQASDDLLALNKEMGNQKSSSLSTLSIILTLIVVAIVVAAFAVSSMFARYTAKDFSEPIIKVEEAAKQLALGNLSVKVEIDSHNELGEMAESFNQATERLRTYIDCVKYGLSEIGKGNFAVRPDIEFHGDFIALKESIEDIIQSLSTTLRQVNEGADQVALGATQLAENAQTLAEGATSQAGAVQELTATIEGVADAAVDNAHKADEAFKSAEEFAKVAMQSSKEMELLTEAMERITVTSQEIESIIGEIEDIASQTNLLSLNASIEAARAGEAGKGFAVVADQIGKLATDSAKSAVNTRELIAKSLTEIGSGNEITTRTASALEEVMEGIKQLAAASKESSSLSADQAETMAQVKLGIEQIAEVVQSNSASAEETSATSEELSAQSENLKALIEQFILAE
jgi:methyl-accepting chemotaxis protein